MYAVGTIIISKTSLSLSQARGASAVLGAVVHGILSVPWRRHGPAGQWTGSGHFKKTEAWDRMS